MAAATTTYRAVAFVRVSTEQQDYTRQINDIMPVALQDGYAKKEIYIIKYKESAVKYNVQNRLSIKELRETIEANPIEAVYVTEVSRLARRGDVLYSVLSLLEEHKISLVTLTPSILRTYENGKPNPIAHVVIAFLGQVAEEEIKIKKERQASGVQQAIKEGKVISPTLPLGYKRVKGYAVIDQDEAAIVADIFNTYVSGNISAAAIYDRYRYSDVFNSKIKENRKNASNLICRILKNTTYIGQNPHYQYPRIIDDDTFNAAQEKMKANATNKDRHTDNIAYCRGLLYIEGKLMIPNFADAQYVCRDGMYVSVNMNVADSLIWNLAAEAKALTDNENYRDNIEHIKKQVEDNKQKIKNINAKIQDVNNKIERASELYIDGAINKTKYNGMVASMNIDKEQLLKDRGNITSTTARLEAILLGDSNSPMKTDQDYNNIISIVDDSARYAIIRETIKKVTVKQVEDRIFNLYVEYTNAALNNDAYYIYRRTGGKQQYLYAVYDEGRTMEDYTNAIVNRIRTRQQIKWENKNGTHS